MKDNRAERQKAGPVEHTQAGGGSLGARSFNEQVNAS